VAEQDFALKSPTPEQLRELVKQQLDVHRKAVAAAGVEIVD